nr:MAG TPA: YopX protein [Caudoviricetes sp.]
MRRLKGSGSFSRDSKLAAYEHIHYKTIGNIHENPEFLEEK